jgi:hypothetical protein
MRIRRIAEAPKGYGHGPHPFLGTGTSEVRGYRNEPGLTYNAQECSNLIIQGADRSGHSTAIFHAHPLHVLAFHGVVPATFEHEHVANGRVMTKYGMIKEHSKKWEEGSHAEHREMLMESLLGDMPYPRFKAEMMHPAAIADVVAKFARSGKKLPTYGVLVPGREVFEPTSIHHKDAHIAFERMAKTLEELHKTGKVDNIEIIGPNTRIRGAQEVHVTKEGKLYMVNVRRKGE